MSADPFASANQQMAQAFQQVMESWWQTLLGDAGRLTELAALLGRSGAGEVADLKRVLTALELLEGRVGRIESQVQTLAEALSTLVRHLDSKTPGDRA